MQKTFRPGEFGGVATGIAVQLIPDGTVEADLYDEVRGQFSWYARIAERSGLATKKGLHVIGGVIDRGYTGELIVCLANLGFMHEGILTHEDFVVNPGDKIAQLVPTIIPRLRDVGVEVSDLGPTARGDRGFGSTGK